MASLEAKFYQFHFILVFPLAVDLARSRSFNVMNLKPEKNFPATRSTLSPKRFVGDEVFDEPLRGVDDLLPSLQKREETANPPKDNREHILTMKPHQHASGQPIQEIERRLLDETMPNKASASDRVTAVPLWGQLGRMLTWPMRTKSSFSSNDNTATITNHGKKKEKTKKIRYKNPWAVNSLWDLWRFFGPVLTFLIALQIFSSLKLAELLKKLEIPNGHIPVNRIALVIALVSVFTNFLVIKGCKGQDYKNFIPRLLGIGIVNTLITLISFFLLDYL